MTSIPTIRDDDRDRDRAARARSGRAGSVTPLELELVESPRWKPTFVLRGLEALRVRV